MFPSRPGILPTCFQPEEIIVTLDELAIDFPALFDKRRTLVEETSAVVRSDLRGMTSDLYDRVDQLTARVSDAAVVFVAADPAEDGAPGWNLAHVVVHVTAGLEENAAQGATLARGAEITGRPRFETPWETVTTAAQVRQRLAESRRMSMAFLDAWPDQPHGDNVHEHPAFGASNAVAYHVLGLVHGRGHLAQLKEIVSQATASDGTGGSENA
jgi:hypothetical protein